MYQLIFEDRFENERLLTTIESEDEAMKHISKFCGDHNFTIHYARSWTDKNGDTIFDVGSHSEFFIVRPVAQEKPELVVRKI